METGQEPLVNTAAYLAKSIIYNNKERLLASLIVAGYDKQKGGQVKLSSINIQIAIFFRNRLI
jgi:20S proteasome subunit beta 1